MRVSEKERERESEWGGGLKKIRIGRRGGATSTRTRIKPRRAGCSLTAGRQQPPKHGLDWTGRRAAGAAPCIFHNQLTRRGKCEVGRQIRVDEDRQLLLQVWRQIYALDRTHEPYCLMRGGGYCVNTIKHSEMFVWWSSFCRIHPSTYSLQAASDNSRCTFKKNTTRTTTFPTIFCVDRILKTTLKRLEPLTEQVKQQFQFFMFHLDL